MPPLVQKNQEKINNQVYQAQQAQITEAFAPVPTEPMYQPQSAPVYAQSLAAPQPQYGGVQRLTQDETEQPKIVGISGAGIVENIKKNPIPWALGAGAVVLLLMRNNQPTPNYQPNYAGASR